jgi:hypothetical protein
LVESYELGFGSEANEVGLNGTEALYFAHGSAGEPWIQWYEIAGIAAELPATPVVYLQRGLHKRLVEHQLYTRKRGHSEYG